MSIAKPSPYVYAYIDHEDGNGIELYFEDDKIAFNTWKTDGHTKYPRSFHEIMLSIEIADTLIEALTRMKTTIQDRAKGITP